MKVAVLLKEVVDLVEELVINDDGSGLDRDELAFKSNEFDDYALEEILQIKTEGDTVDAYALDGLETDAMLHMAMARGADNLFKVLVNGKDLEETAINSIETSHAFMNALAGENYDLIVTGVQGVDDLYGWIAGHLGQMMNLPSLSIITRIEPAGDKIVVHKEFSGGITGEYEIQLPAVLGVQAARSSPSYIPVSKVRKIAKEATITEKAVDIPDVKGSSVVGVEVPVSGSKAEMISGDVDAQVNRFMEILKERGLK